MNKLLISIPVCALLTLCSCKGRHADGTPTGETVEVNIEAMEPVPAPDDAPAAPLPAEATDSAATTDSLIPLETNL